MRCWASWISAPFAPLSCQSRTPMRNVQFIEVKRRGDLVILEILANAFLHHMVRNIAGALLAVGDGRKPLYWIAELLAARDRTMAAETAPASGLYLVDVEYPSHFGLPLTPYGPMLLGTNTVISACPVKTASRVICYHATLIFPGSQPTWPLRVSKYAALPDRRMRWRQSSSGADAIGLVFYADQPACCYH